MRRLPDSAAAMEQPETRRVEIDAELARFGEWTNWTSRIDIVQERVQKLMHTGVDRKEWNLVPVRAVEGDHAQMVSAIPGGNAAPPAASIPYQGHVVRDDEIDYAALKSGDDRLAIGRLPYAAFCNGGLGLNAASHEIASGFPPESLEAPELGGCPLDLIVHDLTDRDDQGLAPAAG
jgi:hypothetical protein